MNTFPSVWPLPYGINIRKDYSEEHNYFIARSQTDCWPLQLNDYDQVRVSSVFNGWEGTLPNTIKAWLGYDPNGGNIIPPLSTYPSQVHLGKIGNTWLFYKNKPNYNKCEKANIEWMIDPSHLYYFNLQNLENKDNAYYLKFEFMKNNSIMCL